MCDGIYAKPEDLERMWWFVPSGEQLARFQDIVRNGATEITATLYSVGACSCTWGAWVDDFLKYINLLIAGSLLDAPVNRLSPEQRKMFRQVADRLLMKISEGDLELCSNATGKKVPSWAVANYVLTPFQATNELYKALVFEGSVDDLVKYI